MNDEQLLAAHRNARRAVRLALDGLNEEALRAKDERGRAMAHEVGHLVAAECHFLLRELKLDARIEPWNGEAAMQAASTEFTECLDQIERRWPELLAEHPDHRDLRVVLLRMTLHTLYHLPIIINLRVRHDPKFQLPHWSQVGSWESAIGPILDGAV